MGRPSDYNEETAAAICERIAHGQSLVRITKEDGFPGYSTVMDWLILKPEFSERYARARASQADYLAEETLAIADLAEDAQKARLQVDARKWYAGKLAPKKYGDKVQTEVSGSMTISWEDALAQLGKVE